MFRANTWEEIEKLAAKKEVFQEMVVTMKKLTAEERIQMELEAREDYERRMSTQYHFGLKNGRLEGRAEGRMEGENRVSLLYDRLLAENRLHDMRQAIREPAYRQRLLEEFGL